MFLEDVKLFDAAVDVVADVVPRVGRVVLLQIRVGV